MSEPKTVPANQAEPPQPHQVRIPGFAADRSIGLGDAVSGVAQALGFRPCGGCARRASALNNWVVFTRS
jgi:hypothetical protein